MSVTDGNLTTDGAQQTVRIAGVVQTTSSGGSSTVTANQGTAAPSASAWPIKIVDGGGVNVAVVDGSGHILTIPTQATAANLKALVDQGTAAALGSAWPIKLTDGSNVVAITTGSEERTTSGTVTATTSLSAVTTGTGTVIDFGSAKSNISMAVILSAGTPTAGEVTLDVSQDNTNWVPIAKTTTLAAGVNQSVSASGVAYRYARARVSTTVAGVTVTCTVMGS